MTSRADSADGLAHTLQPRHVAMISFGGIIGAGLFVGSGAAIHIGGPAVLLTYLGCGGLVFLIMRMLGEMAVALPNRGSFADYAAIGLGPWASFVTGWLYWYFWVYTVGAETVAGANLIHDLGISAPVWLIGLVLVAVMTATNLLSVRAYGELEFWFASLKVSAIAAFILVGIAWLVGFGPGAGRSVTMLAQHGGLFPLGISGVLAAVPTVIFSMMGSEVATIAAAESAAPVANVVRAARTVALRILMFYGASILVILLIIPWDSVLPGHSPFAAVLDRMDIPGTSVVMSVIIITAVLSCLNSGLYITSRMLYELARRGEAPASLAMTARNQVPMLGILIGCLAGFGAAIAELFLPDAVFSYLVSTSGDIILFVYMIIAFAQIRLRRRLQDQGRVLSLRMWLFPWLSYGVIGAIVGVLLLMGVLPDQRSTLLLSGLSVAVVFAALPLRWRREEASIPR